ncbi:DNA-J chaperone, putative [Bodo saltans]|uniref:DNA-J chaperone, putative n=1 Tax=Bodo saltans TaxID=75058 RepID=A0A0S4J092_BODSA|nr:DNA-J chaperone, putative [Bodo saltans]|eukprot:CUG74938.1 DNA-J chaperone, putative [Bodo saltans]
MLRRVPYIAPSHHSIPLCGGGGCVAGGGGCVLVTSMRQETTGEHHSFKPGRITIAMRAVFQALMPNGLRKRLATRMQAGLEKVDDLEKQNMWLRRHGSPLAVMGLPDHASMAEVRTRYRDLILETHPDTAPASTRAAPRRGPGGGSATGSTNRSGNEVTVAEQRDLSEYHILQTAYKMAMDPDSLYHQNSSAPELYSDITAHRPMMRRLSSKITVFAMVAYALMLFIGLYIGNILFKELCERSLEFFDPEFYEFMRGQEVEEERKREAGEFVDVDPKRLAPLAIRKLAYPGRFIHGGETTTEEHAETLAAALAAAGPAAGTSLLQGGKS